MAFIYRDALTPVVYQWASFSSVYHKFTKAWPLHSDGITYQWHMDVFRNGSYNDTTTVKRFLNSLGIKWASILEMDIDPKELQGVFFFLDGSKYQWDGSHAGDSKVSTRAVTSAITAPTAQQVTDYFNNTFEVGDEITVTVQYGGDQKRYVKEHELEWSINESGVVQTEPLNKEAIRTTLESDPWYYLANARMYDYTKDSEQFQLYDGALINVPGKASLSPSSRLAGTSQTSCHVEGYIKPPGGAEEPMYYLGVFAKMSNGTVFEKTGDVFDEQVVTSSNVNYDGEIATYRYSQKYIFKGCTVDSDIIQGIMAWYGNRTVLKKKRRPNPKPVDYSKDLISYNTKDNIFKKALDSMMMYVDPGTGATLRGFTNNLFYDDRLRINESRLMRRADFVEMLATCMDQDVSAEDASFWEKAFAWALVIFSFVLGFFTAGGSIAFTAHFWLAAGSMLGTTAISLSVGMYLLSRFGGASAQGLVKTISGILQVVGYAAMFSGFMAALQNAGKVAIQKQLEDEGVEKITESMIQEGLSGRTLVDNLSSLISQSVESAVSKVTEFVSFKTFSPSSILDGLELLNKGLELYVDHEKKELDEEYQEISKEAERYEAETLSNQFKEASAVYIAMEDRLYSYDALSEVDREVQNAVGQDRSYMTWYSNVNSV